MGPQLVLLALVAAVSAGSLPSYIAVCKRDDPKINDCVLKAIQTLREKLLVGIPELDVPALEPLVIPHVTISPGDGMRFKAVGSNVKIHGAGNFKITKLNVDVAKHTFSAGLEIPSLYFEADYDVDARLLAVTLKGRGPLTANATDCTGEFILKGQLVKRDGTIYLYFYSSEVFINVKQVRVHLEGLFNGDRVLGDATNQALNENSGDFWPTVKPIAERTIAGVLLEVANNITKHFSYDDLFPKK